MWRLEPGFPLASFLHDWRNAVVVALFSGGAYVLPIGAIPGITSRLANPGETIVLSGLAGYWPGHTERPRGTTIRTIDQPDRQLHRFDWRRIGRGFVCLVSAGIRRPLSVQHRGSAGSGRQRRAFHFHARWRPPSSNSAYRPGVGSS